MSKNSSDSNKSPGRGLVVFVFLIVLGLWLMSVVLVPWAAGRYYGLEACVEGGAVGSPREQEAANRCLATKQVAYGTFGDSFGAVNALFSGLALAGVVLTLFFHSEGAKRATKPFVIPKLRRGDGDARVTVGAPNRAGARVTLPVRVTFLLQNASVHPALNIDSTLSLNGLRASANGVIDVPLAATAAAPGALEFTVMGAEASTFVQAVCAGGVRALLRVEYGSVEGVRWFSEVAYLLKVSPNRDEDGRLLRDAVDGALAAENLWAADATVDLEFEAISGTWRYGEV